LRRHNTFRRVKSQDVSAFSRKAVSDGLIPFGGYGHGPP